MHSTESGHSNTDYLIVFVNGKVNRMRRNALLKIVPLAMLKQYSSDTQ